MKPRAKLLIVLQVLIAGAVIWLMFSSDPVRNYTLHGLRSLAFSIVWDGWHGSRVEWKGVPLQVPTGRYWWRATGSEQLSLHTRNPEVAGILTLRTDGLGDDYLSVVKRRCEHRQCDSLSERREQIGGSEAEILEFESSPEGGERLRYAFLRSPKTGVLIEVVSRPDVFATDFAVARSLLDQLARGRSQG